MTRSVVTDAVLSGSVIGVATYMALENLDEAKKDIIDDMITGAAGDLIKTVTGNGLFGSAGYLIPAYFRFGNRIADYVSEGANDPTRRIIAAIGVGAFVSLMGLIRASTSSRK